MDKDAVLSHVGRVTGPCHWNLSNSMNPIDGLRDGKTRFRLDFMSSPLRSWDELQFLQPGDGLFLPGIPHRAFVTV